MGEWRAHVLSGHHREHILQLHLDIVMKRQIPNMFNCLFVSYLHSWLLVPGPGAELVDAALPAEDVPEVAVDGQPHLTRHSPAILHVPGGVMFVL